MNKWVFQSWKTVYGLPQRNVFFNSVFLGNLVFFEDIGLIKSKALQLTLSECLDIPFERSFGAY